MEPDDEEGTAYVVVYTERADAELDEAWRWLAEHDGKQAAGVLFDELDRAVDKISRHPRIGPPYGAEIDGRTVRRVPLPRSRYGLYYVVDDERRLIELASLWSAVRGRGPRFTRPRNEGV